MEDNDEERATNSMIDNRQSTVFRSTRKLVPPVRLCTAACPSTSRCVPITTMNILVLFLASLLAGCGHGFVTSPAVVASSRLASSAVTGRTTVPPGARPAAGTTAESENRVQNKHTSVMCGPNVFCFCEKAGEEEGERHTAWLIRYSVVDVMCKNATYFHSVSAISTAVQQQSSRVLELYYSVFVRGAHVDHM